MTSKGSLYWKGSMVASATSRKYVACYTPRLEHWDIVPGILLPANKTTDRLETYGPWIRLPNGCPSCKLAGLSGLFVVCCWPAKIRCLASQAAYHVPGTICPEVPRLGCAAESACLYCLPLFAGHRILFALLFVSFFFLLPHNSYICFLQFFLSCFRRGTVHRRIYHYPTVSRVSIPPFCVCAVERASGSVCTDF